MRLQHVTVSCLTVSCREQEIWDMKLGVAHLLQHGADEVGGLQELQVDVHVEGHLPPPLQLLLLRRLVLVPVLAVSLSLRMLATFLFAGLSRPRKQTDGLTAELLRYAAIVHVLTVMPKLRETCISQQPQSHANKRVSAERGAR